MQQAKQLSPFPFPPLVFSPRFPFWESHDWQFATGVHDKKKEGVGGRFPGHKNSTFSNKAALVKKRQDQVSDEHSAEVAFFDHEEITRKGKTVYRKGTCTCCFDYDVVASNVYPT